MQAIADIAFIALKSKRVLERWKTVVSTMLEKLAGNPLIEKLRTIHLFEANWNLVKGMIFGRKLMWNGLDNEALDPNQYGGMPGKSPADVLLMKTLNYHMLSHESRLCEFRQRRKGMFRSNHHAASCTEVPTAGATERCSGDLHFMAGSMCLSHQNVA